MGKKYQPPEVTRYGLSTGEIAVLPTESEEELEKIMDLLDEEHEPETPYEHFLVDQMIRARWDAERFRRLEANAFDRMLEDQYGSPNADRRLLIKLEQPGNVFDRLQKLGVAAERAYTKGERDMAQHRAKTQKARKQNEANSALPLPDLASVQNEANPGAPAPAPAAIQNEANLSPDRSVQDEPNSAALHTPRQPLAPNEANLSQDRSLQDEPNSAAPHTPRQPLVQNEANLSPDRTRQNEPNSSAPHTPRQPLVQNEANQPPDRLVQDEPNSGAPKPATIQNEPDPDPAVYCDKTP